MSVAALRYAPLRAIPDLKLRWDPLRIGLFLLTVFTISRIHQRYPWFAALKPMMVLSGMCFFYAIANPRALAAKNVLQSWPMKLVLAFVAMACLSVPFGISMGNSGRFILESYSRTLIYAFLLALAIRQARDLYMFMWAYVLACGILCWLALFIFQMKNYSASYAERLGNLYTYDSNDLGLVVLVGLAFALAILQVAKWKGKIAVMTIIIGIGGTIARSGSRGAFVGMLFFGVALLSGARTMSLVKRVLIVVTITLGLLYWAPKGYWKQMQTVFAPQQDYNWDSQEGRRKVMERGFGYMLDYPIAGLGIANFTKAECEISTKLKTHRAGTGLRCTPPHNSYVQAGAETGILGLLIWCGIIVGIIVAMRKLPGTLPPQWRKGTPAERFCYIAPTYLSTAMVSFAATSFFLSFAWMDVVYVLCAFTAGMYTCIEVQKAAMTPSAGPMPQQAMASARVATRPVPMRQPILAPAMTRALPSAG